MSTILTREEMLQKADAELKTAMEDLRTALNGGERSSVVKAKKKIVTEKVAAYNKTLADNEYLRWSEEGIPVIKKAVEIRAFKNGLRVQTKQDPNTDKWTVKVVAAEVLCDFFEIFNVLGDSVFESETWDTTMTDFLIEMCNTCDSRLTKKKMVHVVDTTMIQKLQAVFDSILVVKGENGENIIKAEVDAFEFIRSAVFGKGEVGQIVAINTSKFNRIVLEAMHVIITPDMSFSFAREEE